MNLVGKTMLERGWLQNHNPFEDHFSQLSCITNGVVAEENVNSHMAKEIGSDLVESMVDKSCSELHFKRKNKVKPLASANKAAKVA